MKLKTKTQKIIAAIICIALPMIVGFISSSITGDVSYKYNMFNQPPLSPPGWLFGIMWPILYILMGISSFLILNSDIRNKKKYIGIYLIQLAVNFIWMPVFFAADMFWFAAIIILVLDILVITMCIWFKMVNNLASYLLIPYIVWILFATYLNIGFAVLN